MRKHRMFVLGAGLLALSLFAAACSDSGGDDDTGGSASASESSAPKPETGDPHGPPTRRFNFVRS